MFDSLSIRAAFGASLAVAALVACSAGSPNGVILQDDGPNLGQPTSSSGASGSSGSSGSSGTTTDAATSCFDPSCPLALCQCKDKTVFSPAGVCKENGRCAVASACESACGAAGFSGFVVEGAPCTDSLQCSLGKSQPTVDCDCASGIGPSVYPVCNAGHCSAEQEHACPKSCASYGGWRCRSAIDCAPVVCECKDGRNPVTASTCNGGACGPASAVCPAACGTHGGWKGTTVAPPDAGPTTPKGPGEPCSVGSDCAPLSCTCNNGATFNGNKVCESNKCATKASACGFVCMGNGGWSGT